ncbi:putative HEPACAM family member 2-like, partial [Triplophysa rosa]
PGCNIYVWLFLFAAFDPLNATGIVVSWSYNNTSVSLTCKVSGTYTDIMWMREDSPIQRDNRHSFSNQTLHISNITNLDYGQYSCVATNSYEKSETQIYIISEECSTNGENTTFYQEHDANSNRHQAIQIFLWSGLALGILGLCISVFYGINKYRHSQVHRQDTKQDGNTRGHRREDDRTTEEDVDIDLGIYQEVPGTEVSLLPYVYTDFIKPREANQNSAAAEDTKDFGYSEIGPAVGEEIILDRSSSDEQSTPCTNTAEE